MGLAIILVVLRQHETGGSEFEEWKDTHVQEGLLNFYTIKLANK